MRQRAGYSFTEVMFAVVVLGIGFIMIAAIFPAAILQSKTTAEETSGAAFARASMQYLEQVGRMPPPPTPPYPAPTSVFMPYFPADFVGASNYGKVRSLKDPQTTGVTALSTAPGWLPDQLWNALKGSLINETDTRLAWTGFYKRDRENGGPSQRVQVIIITAEVRNRSSYKSEEDLFFLPGAPPIMNLQARPVRVTMVDIGGGVYTPIIHDDPTTGLTNGLTGGAQAAGEGSFLVIANDHVTTASAGLFNGHVYRLGSTIETLGGATRYDFGPGNEYKPDPGPDGAPGGGDDVFMPTVTLANIGTYATTGNWAEAFVLGRNINTAGGYEGNVQDVSVYTTFIRAQ